MKLESMAKGKLKKLRWKEMSLYIRLRDADSSGYAKCCTCGIVKHYKDLQAGHFIPQAQGDAVRFDERNIHSQDFRCNINLGGNGAEYYPFMVNQYGMEVVDELRRLSRTTVKFTKQDHIDDIIRLRKEIELIREARGL